MASKPGSQRHATLTEDFGKGVVLEHLTYSEEIDCPFQLSLLARAPNGEMDFTKFLGKAIDVKLVHEAGEYWFNGILCEAAFETITDGGEATYRLELCSFLDVLKIGADCRIFQDMTADQIIKDVASKRGFEALDFTKLQKKPEKRDYCVQYRESDFAFITRLLAEEGISYSFKHERGRHTALFVDNHGGREKTPGSPLPFARSVGEGSDPEIAEVRITHWAERVRLRPNKVTLADFDFKTPKKPLKAEAAVRSSTAVSNIEVYDHPGDFDSKADQPGLAGKRLDAHSADRTVIEGEGSVFLLRAGQVFKLKGHDETRHDQDHLVISLSLSIAGEVYRSGEETDSFAMSFEAVPATSAWRPATDCPKPVIAGFQTAIVTGKSGDKIYVDEHSRIKVRFPWDRSGSKDEESSCWVRVSQFWADTSFGALTIPRIGEEVLISFLEGDPDRPMVVGRVYNADRKPPLDLPNQQTQSIWRSQTIGTPGPYPDTKKAPATTKDTGFNEFSFEDKGGEEKIYMHAQRDMRVAVRFDNVWDVGHDANLDVGNNRLMTIGKDDTEKVEGSQELAVKKDRNAKVDGNESLKVGSKMKIDVGATLEIEAQSKITITCGGSKIEMTPQGIKIEAMSIEAKASMEMKTSGTMSEHKAGGIMTIQGSLVKIN